jgi:hypothetical protein
MAVRGNNVTVGPTRRIAPGPSLGRAVRWFPEVFEVSRKKVVVLGSNFGGLTDALAVKLELKADVDVTVVSPSPQFLLRWPPRYMPARAGADCSTSPAT